MESGVRITATIGLEIEAYGEIEVLVRAGNVQGARTLAIDIVQDLIDCGYTKNMKIAEIDEVTLQK